MSRIRLYIDEDSMSHALLGKLRANGEDVTTADEEGMRSRTDDEHVDYAVQLGRCVYSGNVADFPRIHGERLNRGESHWGIVVLTDQRLSGGEQARRLTKLMDNRTADEMRDALEFLSDWR